MCNTNPVVLFLVVSQDAQLASVYVSMSGFRMSCVCLVGLRLRRVCLVPLRRRIMRLSFLLSNCVGDCSDLASSFA